MSLLCTLNANRGKQGVRHFGFHEVACAIKHHASFASSLQVFELLNGNECGVHVDSFGPCQFAIKRVCLPCFGHLRRWLQCHLKQ